jgi:hypothetical protein
VRLSQACRADDRLEADQDRGLASIHRASIIGRPARAWAPTLVSVPRVHKRAGNARIERLGYGLVGHIPAPVLRGFDAQDCGRSPLPPRDMDWPPR